MHCHFCFTYNYHQKWPRTAKAATASTGMRPPHTGWRAETMPGEPSVSCTFLYQEGGADACTEVSHASSVRGVASQVDAAARDPLGRHQWSGDSPRGRNHSGLTAASPTGIPVLFRAHAARQKLQFRAPRRGVSAGPHAGACSYKRIESLLKKGLDRQPLPQPPDAIASPPHPNIRGPQYYTDERGEP